MSQFGKVHLLGLMHSVECSLEGVSVAKVPPIEQMNFPQATLVACTFAQYIINVTGTTNIVD